MFLIFAISVFAKYPFVVYYGSSLSYAQINEFNYAVIDPNQYNDGIKFKNTTYAYISLGEVESYREYFYIIKNKKLLLEENKNWSGSYVVNLSSDEWQKFVLNKIIPSIIAKGYSALFLDTVDSLIDSKQDLKLIIDFINSIKKQYPELNLMLNRGFEVANSVNVDSVLLESTISTVLDNNKTVLLKDIYKPKIENKKLFSLNYWNIDDKKGIEYLYNKSFELGYIPFVADFSLMKMPNYIINNNHKLERFK